MPICDLRLAGPYAVATILLKRIRVAEASLKNRRVRYGVQIDPAGGEVRSRTLHQSAVDRGWAVVCVGPVAKRESTGASLG